jgi:catechol 2,3-dioxygenase-like lactoylglutathione lyase family enzyme
MTRMATSVQSIGHLVVEVTSLPPALDFYRDGLGLGLVGTDFWPGCANRHAVLKAGAHYLVLAEVWQKPDLSAGGGHQAYRLSRSGHKQAVDRLAALGCDIQTYHESRPAEAGGHVYVTDPSGNRVQLVPSDETANGGVVGIDHVCVEDANLHRAELFYSQVLGLDIDHVSGTRTSDFTRAREWGEGAIAMMPGACRWVRYYRAIKGQNQTQARPNLQMYFRAGDGVIGVYMAMEDYAEPPETQQIGTPRIGLQVADDALDAIAARLQAARRPFDGPVEHGGNSPIARSLYCKDAGGNFIEFSVSTTTDRTGATP